MQVIVHFGVGMLGGLVIVLLIDRHPREEFAILMGSGFWAVLPDVNWFIREVGIEPIGAIMREFHRSIFANIFWFHQLIDRFETGNRKLEGGIGIFLVFVATIGYLLLNDW